MLTLIPDLPASVVGVEAHGKVTAEDYQEVLIPAVEAAEAASSDRKVRVLYVLGREFPEFTAGAAWEDTKLGLRRLRHWERIAVVGDAVWVRSAIHGLGWAMPGEVRVYASGALNEARAWVTSPGRRERVSGARRFFADMIIGFRMLNEARYRVMRAVFGVQRDWRSNVVTLMVFASAVDAIRRVISAPGTQARKMRSSPTVVEDSMLVAAVLNEAINRVTTRRAKATASVVALVVFAVGVTSIRPTVERSLRAIRATISWVIVEARKVRDAIGRYGAESVRATAEADLARSPSGAGSRVGRSASQTATARGGSAVDDCFDRDDQS